MKPLGCFSTLLVAAIFSIHTTHTRARVKSLSIYTQYIPIEISVTGKIDRSPPVTSRPWNVVVCIPCPGLGIAPKNVNPRVPRSLFLLRVFLIRRYTDVQNLQLLPMIHLESHTSIGKVHCATLRLCMNGAEELMLITSSDTLFHTCMSL